MPDSPKTALILAGHGSHISPNTAGIVWQYVDALRALGVADEITAAFWKEPPAFHTVFRTLLASDITIVPMFTANGYFTETVIPAEMGLTGETTLRDGRTLRYTRPIGEHAIIGQIVEQRARDAMRDYALTPAQTCLTIIGHSTRRNPRSRAATEAQAERLRSLDIAAEVHAVYLDDDPEIPTIYTTTQQQTIVAIPYFLAAGSHTTMDVPDELGIGAGQTSGVVEGHQVYYTPPIGSGTELLPAVLDLAREAGMLLHDPRENGSAWDCFPQAGREAWLARFAEVERSFPVGGFWLNAGRAWAANRTSASTHALHTPAEVRDHARTMPFHPLAAEIAPDWYVQITQPEQLHTIMETIHPGVVAEWALLQQGDYQPNTLEQVLARQTGMYKRLAALDEATIDHITRTTCLAECPRAPMWSALNKGSALPCYEPCNVWLSAALAHLDAKNAATYAD